MIKKMLLLSLLFSVVAIRAEGEQTDATGNEATDTSATTVAAPSVTPDAVESESVVPALLDESEPADSGSSVVSEESDVSVEDAESATTVSTEELPSSDVADESDVTAEPFLNVILSKELQGALPNVITNLFGSALLQLQSIGPVILAPYLAYKSYVNGKKTIERDTDKNRHGAKTVGYLCGAALLALNLHNWLVKQG